MMDITYGLAIHSYDDDVSPLSNPSRGLFHTFPKYISDAEAVLRFVEHAILPGSYMVDLIPA
jgi:hypothetical protein